MAKMLAAPHSDLFPAHVKDDTSLFLAKRNKDATSSTTRYMRCPSFCLLSCRESREKCVDRWEYFLVSDRFISISMQGKTKRQCQVIDVNVQTKVHMLSGL
jgi:hypothetical protein